MSAYAANGPVTNEAIELKDNTDITTTARAPIAVIVCFLGDNNSNFDFNCLQFKIDLNDLPDIS